MQMPDGCRLAYTIAHEAWYPSVITDPHISVAASVIDGGGVAWEFIVEERELRHDEKAIRVGVFDDAFEVFEHVPEFFAALSEKKPRTLGEVVDVLKALGAVDETEYVRR